MSSAERIRRRLVAHRRSSTRNLTELCDVFSVIDSETHKIVKYCLPELVKEGTISAERAEEYKKIPNDFSFSRIYNKMNKFAIGQSSVNLFKYIDISEEEFKEMYKLEDGSSSIRYSDLTGYLNMLLHELSELAYYMNRTCNSEEYRCYTYIKFDTCKNIHDYFVKTYKDLASIVKYLEDIKTQINKAKVQHPDKSIRSILCEFGRFLEEFIYGRLETVNMLLHSSYMYIFAPMLKRSNRTCIFEEEFTGAFVRSWLLKHVERSVLQNQLRTPIFEESCKWLVNNFFSGLRKFTSVFDQGGIRMYHGPIVDEIGSSAMLGKFFHDQNLKERVKKAVQKYDMKHINTLYTNDELDKVLRGIFKTDLQFTDPVKFELKMYEWKDPVKFWTAEDSIGYGIVFECFIDWLKERNCILLGIPLAMISYEMSKVIYRNQSWNVAMMGIMILENKTDTDYKEYLLQSFSKEELENALKEMNEKKENAESTENKTEDVITEDVPKQIE